MINRNQVLNYVRTKISDPSSTTFSIGDLNVFLDRAVSEYSRYRPLDDQRGTFTTVANQERYPAPTGLEEILEWNRQLWTTTAMREMTNTLPPPLGYTNDYVEMEIAAQNLDTLYRFNEGFLETEFDPLTNTNTIIVEPVPLTSGLVYVYTYTASHIVDANGNYPSIPTRDRPIVESLVLSDVYTTIASEIGKVSHLQVADTSQDPADSIRLFRQMASDARFSAISALEDTVVERG